MIINSLYKQFTVNQRNNQLLFLKTIMGNSCTRAKTQKLEIQSRVNDSQNKQNHHFIQEQESKDIGEYFQHQAEKYDLTNHTKLNEWNEILLINKNLLKDDKNYQECQNTLEEHKNQGPPQNEVVDFLNYVEQDNDGKPNNEQENEIKVSKVKSPFENPLDDLKAKNWVGYFQQNDEILLYYFLKKQPVRFKQLQQKGLSFKQRWKIWKIQLFEDLKYDDGLFEDYKNMPSEYDKAIDKDIKRTYPNHVYFRISDSHDSNPMTEGLTSLKLVLKAISLDFPEIGYSQGMNYLMGFLLITSGGNEKETFWVFKSLATNERFLVKGLYERGFPLMNLLLGIFRKEFEANLPRLHRYFEEESIYDSLFIPKWFGTLFTHSFPMGIVYRIWDYLLSSNILALVSVTLAILQQYQEKFLRFDLEEFQRFIKQLGEIGDLMTFYDKSSEYYLDVNAVIALASGKFRVKSLSYQDADLSQLKYFDEMKRLASKKDK